MTSRTLVGSALAVLTCAAVLTGCGNDTTGHDMGSMPATTTAAAPGSAQAAGEHNAADVAFAQQMIPHHSQAVEMAGLVDGRSATPKIVDLAGRIKKAQDPEIATLTGWLQAWGESTTASTDGTGHSMPGVDHGSAMPGMMTEQDMSALRAATGEDFDRRWLSLMIVHHQGAVEMAKTELAGGADPDAKKLAQQIIDAQNAEIREMQALLPQG